MAVYGGAVAWWRVIHSDGTPAPGHDSVAVKHYLAEGTPLRSARPPVRVDMRRARWPGGSGPRMPRPGGAQASPRHAGVPRISREMSVASAGMPYMDQSNAPAYRLIRRPSAAASAPRLDQAQQQVVDHAGGPLLVLAGPGTGKTTTIVATVADRIENRGISPERILVLTFSRKAAAELRERITARLRRTTREPLAVTFHSYAYALARREFVLAGDEPPRLLSAPEQLLEVRRLLKGESQDGGARWPERLRPALATRGFAEEVRDLLLRAAERGLDGRGLRQLGKLRDRDDWMAAAAFLDRYAARFDLAPVPAYDYAEIVRIAAALLGRRRPGSASATPTTWCWSTSTRTATRPRSRC